MKFEVMNYKKGKIIPNNEPMMQICVKNYDKQFEDAVVWGGYRNTGLNNLLQAVFHDDEIFGNIKSPEIENIYVNDKKKTVCVKFKDGGKQVVKCNDKDDFDVTIGVALAYVREVYGSSTQFKKNVEEIIEKSKSNTNKEVNK